MKVKTLAHREVINNRYKSVKPYIEYIVITDKTEIVQKNSSTKVIYNYELLTKLTVKSGKINRKNEMVLIPQVNGVFEDSDIKRMGWVFEEKEIEVNNII